MEVCEMQKAETVLSILREKSEERESYTFNRLYRNLFNKDFFLRAYATIYAKEGNMTPGTDEKTIDGFGYHLIEELIEQLKTERYYPNPTRRAYIPKKRSKKLRPLGIPSFQDKLVQEVVKQILEAIYEPLFKDSSHGFREGRSCHTALYQIKNKCKGANWFIEGDIKGFFDNMNQETLIKLLEKKIKDGRLIELIKRFLKAGYMERRQIHNSLSGTPQGGIISPILSNIYLHELDKYMENMKNEYNKNQVRKQNTKYHSTRTLRDRYRKQGNWERAEELTKQLHKMPTMDPFDKNYTKIIYVRYCDDFIISVIGSKKLAEEIRDKVRIFLLDKLSLELSLEKTLITHTVKDRARFLGYEINKANNNTYLTRTLNGYKMRAVNGKIQLLVPGEVINEKLKPFRKNNKPIHCKERENLSVKEMILEYNAEIRGLYNYYCLATDVSTKVSKFKFFHYLSMIKTIAKKEKSSVKKVIAKYGIDVCCCKIGGRPRKIIGIKYVTRKGEKTLTYFNDSLKRVYKPRTSLNDIITSKRHEILDRLNACTCELCGYKSNSYKDFVVHHVRKLKQVLEKYKVRDFIPPQWVLVMEGIRRKTLVVCRHCHKEIHD
jgi:group II intron reverse transcriptase/maturase